MSLLTMLSNVSSAGSAYPKTVGTDPIGDLGAWYGAPDGASAPGLDLIRALIAPGGDQTLEFMIDVTELAPSEETYGQTAVYEWYFKVGDTRFGIYGPCRGHVLCDGQTDDPLTFMVGNFDDQRDDCQNPFQTCITNWYGVARLDDYEDDGRIIFPIPRAFLGATKGALVTPAYADSVWAHTYPRSDVPGGSPRDVLNATKVYRVPSP